MSNAPIATKEGWSPKRRRLSRGWSQKSSFHAMVFARDAQPCATTPLFGGYSERMPKAISLVGSRFGKLVIISFVGRLLKGGRMRRCWLASCDCGNEVSVETGALRAGNTTSCGCWRTELLVARNQKHGAKGKTPPTPEYQAWSGLKARCLNPNVANFANYGGRGITVCERWRFSFPNFLSDMGKRPSSAHSLDRIDVNGNYEPGNCRWATWTEQQRNTRRNRVLEILGERATIVEWAERVGVRSMVIGHRLRRGWTAVDAVFGAPLTPTTHKYGGDAAAFATASLARARAWLDERRGAVARAGGT